MRYKINICNDSTKISVTHNHFLSRSRTLVKQRNKKELFLIPYIVSTTTGKKMMVLSLLYDVHLSFSI